MKFESLKVQVKTFTALVYCEVEEQDMCKELGYKTQRTMSQEPSNRDYNNIKVEFKDRW